MFIETAIAYTERESERESQRYTKVTAAAKLYLNQVAHVNFHEILHLDQFSSRSQHHRYTQTTEKTKKKNHYTAFECGGLKFDLGLVRIHTINYNKGLYFIFRYSSLCRITLFIMFFFFKMFVLWLLYDFVVIAYCTHHHCCRCGCRCGWNRRKKKNRFHRELYSCLCFTWAHRRWNMLNI